MKASMFFQKSFWFLMIIVISGFIIRIKGIIEGSFAFTYDVGRDMLALRDIVVNHHIPFIGQTTGLAGVMYGPWWYYILTPSYIAGNGDPKAVVVFIVLTGLFTVVGGYLVGKKLGSMVIALTIAGLLCFSPVMIGLTSQIWNPNIAPLITIVIYILFLKLADVSKKQKIQKWYYYFLLGVFIMLSFEAEIVYGTLLTTGFFIASIFFLRKSLKIKSLLAFLGGAMLILSPRMLFELKHNFLMTKALFTSITAGTITEGSDLAFAEQVPDRFLTLFNYWIDTIAGGNLLLGIVLIVFGIFTLIICRKKIDKSRKIMLAFSGIIITVFYLGLLFFSHDIWPHYIVGLPVVYIVVFGVISGIAYEFFGRVRIFILAGIFILLMINLNPLKVYSDFTGPQWVGDASVYRNQLVVIDYIYKEADGRPFKDIVYTPSVYDYPYQYLFLWYGKNKYGYLPNDKYNKLFFVILEPDKQTPERLVNWLKVRQKDGKIVKEKKFPSGIVVQTRINL